MSEVLSDPSWRFRLAEKYPARGSASLWLGIAILSVVLVGALLAPIVRPGPLELNLDVQLQAPSYDYPFGTDAVGRDILARVLAAARIDLFIALSGVVISFIIGGAAGLVLGFWTSRANEILMRMLDVAQAFPVLILAFALVAFLSRSNTTLIAALAFVNTPIFLRLVRAETVSIRELPFVEAARGVGNSPLRIIRRHVLPNVMTSALIQLTSSIGHAIVIVGALSFLGVGIAPPNPEWGAMLKEGSDYAGQWWVALFPGTAMAVTVLALHLIGEGFVRRRRIR